MAPVQTTDSMSPRAPEISSTDDKIATDGRRLIADTSEAAVLY
jgi:hypothetical protein